MILFWWRGRYYVDVLHPWCVTPFSFGSYYYPLLCVWSIEENIKGFPSLELSGISSILPDIIVECWRLCQKVDHFWHHPGVYNHMSSWYWNFSPIFELVDETGERFCGVMWTHHLDGIFVEVNFVKSPRRAWRYVVACLWELLAWILSTDPLLMKIRLDTLPWWSCF